MNAATQKQLDISELMVVDAWSRAMAAESQLKLLEEKQKENLSANPINDDRIVLQTSSSSSLLKEENESLRQLSLQQQQEIQTLQQNLLRAKETWTSDQSRISKLKQDIDNLQSQNAAVKRELEDKNQKLLEWTEIAAATNAQLADERSRNKKLQMQLIDIAESEAKALREAQHMEEFKAHHLHEDEELERQAAEAISRERAAVQRANKAEKQLVLMEQLLRDQMDELLSLLSGLEASGRQLVREAATKIKVSSFTAATIREQLETERELRKHSEIAADKPGNPGLDQVVRAQNEQIIAYKISQKRAQEQMQTYEEALELLRKQLNLHHDHEKSHKCDAAGNDPLVAKVSSSAAAAAVEATCESIVWKMTTRALSSAHSSKEQSWGKKIKSLEQELGVISKPIERIDQQKSNLREKIADEISFEMAALVAVGGMGKVQELQHQLQNNELEKSMTRERESSRIARNELLALARNAEAKASDTLIQNEKIQRKLDDALGNEKILTDRLTQRETQLQEATASWRKLETLVAERDGQLKGKVEAMKILESQLSFVRSQLKTWQHIDGSACVAWNSEEEMKKEIQDVQHFIQKLEKAGRARLKSSISEKEAAMLCRIACENGIEKSIHPNAPSIEHTRKEFESKMKRLETSLDEANAAVQRLSRELEDKSRQELQYKRTIEENKLQFDKYKTEKENLQDELHGIHSKLEHEIEAHMNECGAKEKFSQLSLEKLQSEVQGLSHEMMKRNEEMEAHKHECNEKDSTLEKLQAFMQAATIEKEKLERELATKISECQETRAALKSKISEGETRASMLQRLSSEKEKLENELKTKMLEKDASLQAIATQLKSKEAECAKRDSMIKQLETTVQGATAEKERLELELRSKDTEMELHKQECHSRDEQYQGNVRNLSIEKERLELELKNNSSDLVQLQAAVEQLSHQIETLIENEARLTQNNAKLVVENASKSAELEGWDLQCRKLEHQIGQLRKITKESIASKDEIIEAKSAVIVDLKHSLVAALASSEAQQHRAKELEAALGTSTRLIEALRTQASKSGEEARALEASVSQLQIALQDSRREGEKMRFDATTHHESCEQNTFGLMAQVAQLKIDVDAKERELKSKIEIAEKLQAQLKEHSTQLQEIVHSSQSSCKTHLDRLKSTEEQLRIATEASPTKHDHELQLEDSRALAEQLHLQREVNKHKAETQMLRSENDNLMSEMVMLRGQLEASELSRLSSESKVLELSRSTTTEINSLKAALCAEQGRTSALSDQLSVSSVEMTVMEELLAGSMTAYAAKEAQVANLEQTFGAREQEMASQVRGMQQQLQFMEDAQSRLKEKGESLQQGMSNRERESQQLKLAQDDSHVEAADVTRKLAAFQVREEELKEQLCRSEQRSGELEAELRRVKQKWMLLEQEQTNLKTLEEHRVSDDATGDLYIEQRRTLDMQARMTASTLQSQRYLEELGKVQANFDSIERENGALKAQLLQCKLDICLAKTDADTAKAALATSEHRCDEAWAEIGNLRGMLRKAQVFAAFTPMFNAQEQQ